jgi:exodeoxyribonuclease VII small subunit
VMDGKPGDGIDGLTFEQALARLEAIVKKLEAGEASLEDSIGLYEEGTRLKRQCEMKLAQAQARIEKIQVGADGQPAGLAPFDQRPAGGSPSDAAA